MTTVGILGTGTMGAPMARNLAAAGFAVRAWNRSREDAEPLRDAGVVVVDDAAEVAVDAEAVVTMLTDGQAVEETMAERGVLAAMRPETLWLQMSTVGVEAAERLADLARDQDVVYVDAPVLGTKQPAASGDLVVLASGPAEARERAESFLAPLGREVRWVGEAGAGSRLKLVTNFWLLALTEAAAEAIAFAESLGTDPREFLATVEGAAMDSQYLHVKGEAILERRLDPSFSLANAEKDARLVLRAADQAGIELPLARAFRSQLGEAVASGHADEDVAATYFATAGEQ